jgi:hypothetical protein
MVKTVKTLNNIDGRNMTYECQTRNFINQKETGKLRRAPSKLDEARRKDIRVE